MSAASTPTLVLVHGAWHGPWVWNGWRARLADGGYRSVAVTLPGHGEPGRRMRIWNRVGEYLDATAAAIDSAGGPVVTPRPRRAAGMPVMVLAAEHDGLFTRAEQHALARAYGVEATVVTEAGHDLMVDQHAEEGADIVIGWVNDLVDSDDGAGRRP